MAPAGTLPWLLGANDPQATHLVHLQELDGDFVANERIHHVNSHNLHRYTRWDADEGRPASCGEKGDDKRFLPVGIPIR